MKLEMLFAFRKTAPFLMALFLVSVPVACTSKGSTKGEGPDLGLSQIEAEHRSEVVSNVDYDLSFELSETEKLFKGKVEISFDLSKVSNSLFLDFEGGNVQSLQTNGTTSKIQYDARRLRLWSRELKVGRNVVIIGFERVHSDDGSGFHRFTDPTDKNIYLYTNLQPFNANRVFPSFDQPDLKARFRMRVRAPVSWEVVSYAMPENISGGDEKRDWIFPWSARFSTYIFSLHAGPYRVWRSKAGKIPLRLFARKSLADKVDHEEWFKITQQGFEFFQNYFGSEYPFGKYDQLLVPEFNAGAMENVAAVTFTERNIYRSKPTTTQREGRADVILHEMAHMWFGNLVTMRWWDGLWLNESFATYLASLALARNTEFKRAWHSFYSDTKGWAYWSDELVTTHPIQATISNTNEAFANFDGITYGKGAASLKQLHHLIGEEAFENGLKIYFAKHAFKNTELQDFIAALEESSGRSLQGWVREWLMTAGLNTLKLQWACENAKLSKIQALQTAPKDHPTLREHKTRVAFLSNEKGKLKVSSETSLNYVGESSVQELEPSIDCPVAAYANYEDHDYSKVILDPQTLDVARTRLAQVEDPLLRNMMAESLWNMVRDAEWDLVSYLKTIYAYLPQEKDELSAQTVLDTLTSASGYLTRALQQSQDERSTQNIIAQKNVLENFVLARLQAAKPGSDGQTHLFFAFVKIAESPSSQTLMRDWVARKNLPKGLSLGQDRLWNLVKRLNRLGNPQGEALVVALIKKEDNDFAQKAALASRAQRPDAELKKTFWARLQSGKDSLDDQKQIFWNLFPNEQVDLQKEWVEPFFKDLVALSSERDEDFVGHFAENLVPTSCTPESNARLATFLKRQSRNLSPSVVKELRIALQEDERCVKIVQNFASAQI